MTRLPTLSASFQARTITPRYAGLTRPRGLLTLIAWLVLMVTGCSSDIPPESPAATQPTSQFAATQPAEAPAPEPEPEPSPLLPGYEAWSREEALAKLVDESACLSAAVRLVRLAQAAPLCVPEPLPIKIARRLRVVALSESRWALGLATTDERRLAAPLLIGSDGAVTLPLEGVEEEVALLCCAEDAELFPHLLLLPGQVFILGDELQSALVAKSPSGLRFDLLFDGDYPYVALLWRPPPATNQAEEPVLGEPVELARYRWDPWELAFSGPLCDKLPDPQGGLFELDLELSEALIPVGGVLPEPPKIETPRVEPDENEPTPY
ncbi:MAG: hypothetical protein KKI02_11120 [Planctomycetes bacterium]|nr:hypothetical protein [Planctomycetota bacterium]